MKNAGESHILWFLVALGGLFHRSLSTRIWGISYISPLILIIISVMGRVSFTPFNIQTQVHCITLRFFPTILSKSKQNTKSWTEFGLAMGTLSVRSQPSWFVNYTREAKGKGNNLVTASLMDKVGDWQAQLKTSWNEFSSALNNEPQQARDHSC